MSKILSLQNTGVGGEHWFNTTVYGKKQIEAIQDPAGGDTHITPTSIPSPFAQIDLVRIALTNVCKNRDLNSTTLDFKLVSDCLDVGEVFFNIDRLRDKVQILRWDRDKNLKNLLQSPNQRHRRLGEVIKLYLDQDAETYNFGDCPGFNLLIYNHKPIGGTSPKTLFFTSANDLSFVNIKISTNDTLFDKDYKHLWQRSEEYIRFLFAMRKSMPDFGIKFREFNEYLDHNLEIIGQKIPDIYSELHTLKPEYYSRHFDPLDVVGANDAALILNGCILRKAKLEMPGGNGKAIQSDFIINSKKVNGERPPLVLVPGHDGLSRTTGHRLIYFRGPYTPDIIKPTYYNLNTNLDERDLPGITGVKYPHILVSDFLEPYIIRLVYPVNKDRFFDGNLIMQATQKGYVLPIKKAFFDYFDTEDLIHGIVDDGNRMFEMKVTKNDAVEIKLRIPIQHGNYVTFERIYHEWTIQSGTPMADEQVNKGYILENQFGVNIFPMVKFGDNEAEAHYRAILIDRDIADFTRGNNYRLSFFQNKGNVEVRNEIVRQRSDKQSGIATTKIYVLDREFDYVAVDAGLGKGILIPLFLTKSSGSKQFNFAIDFGTTNTHIEFNSEENSQPSSFEITTNEIQIGTLAEPTFYEKDKSVNNTRATAVFEIQQYLLPELLGSKQNNRFPQRTVLYENQRTNFSGAIFSLADMQIAFDYEKKTDRMDSGIRSNLKWSNITGQPDNTKRINAFFEQIMFMLRAKVMLNGGDLAKARFIWFYPTSMTPTRRDKLEDIWANLFQKHIGPKGNIAVMPESLAPFYYYKRTRGIVALKPAICIDIGGGTTDVVIFRNEKPVVLTSFRFAANAIFGDAYADAGNSPNNGFVLKYESKIRDLLASNDLRELSDVLDSIEKRQISEDIIAFFFSLENNREVRNKKIPDNFREYLSEDADMKFVIIIFYTALIYHIANLMLAKNFELPSFMAFSGNGAKTLTAIGGGKALERYTKIIFEKLYKKSGLPQEKHTFDSDGLTIFHEKENSKEVTCKGGLLMKPERDGQVDVEAIKVTLLGTPEPTLSDGTLRYDDEEKIQELLTKVETEVTSFIDFAINLNRDFSFHDNFGASVKDLEAYRTELKKFTGAFIWKGLQLRLEEMPDKNKSIDETLFFYPLVAALNRLALFIYQNNSSKSI